MKTLQIYRSEPDELIWLCIRECSRDWEDIKEVTLSNGGMDYDQLIKEIYDSDRVICWW